MSRWLSVTVLVFAAPVAFADDAEAHKVIDKAIKAEGKGNKISASTAKGKGTYYGMGSPQPYTGSWAQHYPGKARMEIDGVFTLVINGDKGWISAGGSTMELDEKHMAEQKESMHGDWVAELIPLKDKAFTLALIAENKDDKLVGVKVSYKGRRDVNLYFDKESGLLTKIEQNVKDVDAGTDHKQETIIKGYAKVGDVQVPNKIVVNRDGKIYLDGEMTDIKLHDKLPDNTFDKP